MQKQPIQPSSKKPSKKQNKNDTKFIFTQNMLKQLLQACRKTLLQQNKTNNHVRMMLENNVRPITYQNIPILKNSLQNYFKNDRGSEQYQKQNYGVNVLQEYIELQYMMRELSIINPVLDTFYTEYIEHLSTLPQEKQIKKQYVLEKWNSISYRNLNNYLYKFNILEQFQSISKEEFQKELMMCLADNKILQCCEYYKLYNCKPGEFQEFQNNQLIPKISKSDHIFSEHVLNLLEQHEDIKIKIMQRVDPAIGIRVVQSLKQDGRKYKNIHEYLLKQHYKSFLHEHKHYWYIMEDKISFSEKFIDYYTDELLKNPQDSLKWSIDKQDVTNLDVAYSILQRHGRKLPQVKFTYVENPLYKYDFYGSVETIFYDINHHALGKHTETETQQKTQESNNIHIEKIYLDLSKSGLIEQQVVFVQSSQSKQFDFMYEHIITQQKQQNILVGFDTEFKCAQTKFDIQGVSVMQLATNKYGFLIDFTALQKSQKFKEFMKEFLSRENIIKIGHTIDSDIKEMSKTFPMEQNRNIRNFIDIVKIFKQKYPGSKYSSLSYMCDVILGKKLSKYEQRSNWNRRPLKKTQIHYAISDAFACLLLLEKLEDGVQIKKFEEKQYDKQSLTYDEIARQDNLVYSKKYKHILSNKKFLVDNMMKKLCGTMRNCGMDAEFLSVKNYQLALEIALKQQRTIVTRDNRLFSRKQQSVPIYLCPNNADSDQMLQQLATKLKINLTEFSTLSRCVKCNNDQLEVIDRQQAMKSIFFVYQDNTIQQFWRCTKCKQIYWQGNQFKKAHVKYDNLKKQVKQSIGKSQQTN